MATDEKKIKKGDKTTDLLAPTSTKADWEAAGYSVVNPDVFFYKKSTVKDDTITRYRITGVVLARAERAYTEKSAARDAKEGKTKKGPQFFYLLAITRPAVLFNFEGEPVECPIGTIAQVDESFNLAPLKAMLPTLDPTTMRPTRVAEVGIVPLKKVPTANGQNCWKFALFRKDFEASKMDVPLLNPSEAMALVQTAQSYAEQQGQVDENDDPAPERADDIPF